MSARIATGASNRSDLFSARPEINTGRESKRDEYDEKQHDAVDDNNPLQIEHMLGYPGDYRKTILASPRDESMFMKSLGSLVSIENLNDPHSQIFLRGHDMPVCALAISSSGELIASGQVGTKNFKGCAAPIFLWNAHSYRRLAVLRGLTVKVAMLAFSADEQFLSGCDEDGYFYIWDLATAEVVFGQKLIAPVSVLAWAGQRKVGHHNSYELVVGVGGHVNQALLTYDTFRMQWVVAFKPYQVPPSGGLQRTFSCVDLSRDGVFVFVGTSGGEMMVFRRDTLVFRACIPVCTNGLNDLVTLRDDSILCGGGDGSFLRLTGRDMAWHVAEQVKMESGVRTISLTASGAEALVGCASGALYRSLTSGLTYTAVCVSHTSAITCMAFPSSSSAAVRAGEAGVTFATGTSSGEVKVWDLTDYSCVSSIRFPKSGEVKCLTLTDSDTVISGWQDGSIRCTSSAGAALWAIPTAHRDGTTSVAVHLDPALQYFVSGGGDGAVRVWKFSNRELVTQYTEHRRGVSKVLIDIKSPNIVHSVGGDCSVLSFDLKAARRVICHIVNSGAMLSMTQRKDSELELITADTLGRLLYWDIDIRDPVMAVQDPSRTAIRACQISPSGRFLAFAGDDHAVKVLDAATHEVVALGSAHSSPVLSLTWTPDERQLITGGSDSSLCVWNFFLGGSPTSARP